MASEAVSPELVCPMQGFEADNLEDTAPGVAVFTNVFEELGIWANRQSTARSKERKMRYIVELERKIQILQKEAASLSAQLTLLQRDTHGLTSENSEPKLHLQTMEQQVHLQDALNNALKEEIQHLRVLTSQDLTNGAPVMNFPPHFGPNHRFHPMDQTVTTMLTAQQFQQLHIQPRHPFQHQQHHQFSVDSEG